MGIGQHIIFNLFLPLQLSKHADRHESIILETLENILSVLCFKVSKKKSMFMGLDFIFEVLKFEHSSLSTRKIIFRFSTQLFRTESHFLLAMMKIASENNASFIFVHCFIQIIPPKQSNNWVF